MSELERLTDISKINKMINYDFIVIITIGTIIGSALALAI